MSRSASAAFAALALFALVHAASPAHAAPPALAPAHPTRIEWNLTPDQIAINCKTQISAFDTAVKRIMALRGKRTFANTLLPLENAEADFSDRLVAESFLFNMADQKPVRDASEKCNIDQSNYFSQFGARPDVYNALAAVKRSGTAKTVADKKLLDMYLISFRRSGAALSGTKRKAFVDLSNQLTALGSKFSENLNNEAATVSITAAQAASLPPSFVAKLKKSTDGTYAIDVNESTVTTFLNNETDPSARKTYYLAYNNRAPGNVAVLEQAIGVRDRLAHLLGYNSWAAYVLADRMAQTPQRVFAFEK
ncbi:MAG: M3 family metallopeptidase, partial [Candidatus Baltobacteraceae bacterium]